MKEAAASCRLRILHSGDIYLDSPFACLPTEKQEERRREVRSVFLSLMEYIRREKVDLVLISGNLFDNRYVTNSTVELLIGEFSSLPECEFVIAPGTSDACTTDSVYRSGRFPENVHIFRTSELDCIRLPRLHTTVWGWAVTIKKPFAPLQDRKASARGGLQLVCGAVQTGSARVSKPDLQAFGATYAALGGGTPYSTPHKVGESLYDYCGFLEGHDFSREGFGTAALLTAEGQKNEWTVSSERVRFGLRRYATLTLDITGFDSDARVIAALEKALREAGYGEETVLRLCLTGSTPPEYPPLRSPDAALLGLYAITVEDRTTPTYGTEHLLSDMSIRGEFFRSQHRKLEEGTEEERAAAARALRVGLAALDHRDVTVL